MLFPTHPLLQAKVAMCPAVLTNRLKQKTFKDLWESPAFLPTSIPSSLAWNVFLWITLASVQKSLSGTQLKIPYFFQLFALRKHMGKASYHWIWQWFIEYGTKSTDKNIYFGWSKLRTFVLWRTLSKGWTENPQNRRRYLKIIYLIRD